jgi:hypothetical protein
MKITKEQIEELYAFTRLHYVEYYDVQIELVDHMANDIEEICKKNPELSFEEAKNKSFKKFGVFGFMDVVRAQEKALERKYLRLFCSFIKEWFQFPKVLFTLSLIACVYTFLGFQISNFVRYCIFGLYIIYLGYRMFYWNRTYRKKIKKTKKKWLMEGYIYGTLGTGSLGINMIIQTLLFIDIDIANPYVRILYSVVIGAIILAFHVLLEVIPSKAEELLEITHHEYKLVQKS